MADHNKPTNTSLYSNYTSELNGRFVDITVGLDPASTTATNIPDKAIRFNSANSRWEKYDLATTTWGVLDTGYEIDLAGSRKLTANSSDAAFTITQTGTGNAFVVEDSASPDATPFVINADGRVIVGTTSIRSNTMMRIAEVNNSQVGIQLGTLGTDVDKFGRLGFTHYAGDSVSPVAALNFFADSTRNLLNIGGGTSIMNAATELRFQTAENNTTLGGTERMRIDSAGNVGIGAVPGSEYSLLIGKNITGGTGANAVRVASTIQSDVTSSAVSFQSFPTTQATSFTLTNLRHFAADQATFGAGSTVTNQYGFIAANNLTGATNNFGFYSNIASGTGRWNFYANGTADNYFAGRVLIGGTTPVVGAANGSLDIQNTSDAQLSISRFAASTASANFYINKSRGAF
jgi:hypothetical protein